MDFGQQRLQQQESARQMMYQNPGYQFERRDRKTLILDVFDQGSDKTNPLTNATEFSVELFEPLIIDKHSEIYLDSFLTHNSLVCHTGDKMAFSLQINEFNVNTNVATSAPTGTTGGQHTFNRIIIPNEHNSTDNVHSCVIHKGKKMNYVCSINPCKLSKITGKITDLGGNSIYTTSTVRGHDISLLYYISLTNPITKTVPAASIFGFDDGVSPTGGTGFITAFDMENGSTDLYFYAQSGSSVNAGGLDVTREIGSDDTDIGLGLVGGSTLTTTANTFKEGDNPRFIAEFIIVARE